MHCLRKVHNWLKHPDGKFCMNDKSLAIHLANPKWIKLSMFQYNVVIKTKRFSMPKMEEKASVVLGRGQ